MKKNSLCMFMFMFMFNSCQFLDFIIYEDSAFQVGGSELNIEDYNLTNTLSLNKTCEKPIEFHVWLSGLDVEKFVNKIEENNNEFYADFYWEFVESKVGFDNYLGKGIDSPKLKKVIKNKNKNGGYIVKFEIAKIKFEENISYRWKIRYNSKIYDIGDIRLNYHGIFIDSKC